MDLKTDINIINGLIIRMSILADCQYTLDDFTEISKD